MKARTFALTAALMIASLAGGPSISAQEVSFDTVDGGAKLVLRGVLHRPQGEGPFPAVVMLCGSDGFVTGPHARHQSDWAERLAGWGYVALQVDSFTPRGAQGISDNSPEVSPLARSHDAFAAKAYLCGLPFVDQQKIGVLGWSHGSWALMLAIDRYYRDKRVTPFKAAVAFYPYCPTLVQPDTPVLVLIGREDDMTPVGLAEAQQKDYRTFGWKPEYSLVVYPGAFHWFDVEPPAGSPSKGTDARGHRIEYDAAASVDASARTRDFLAKYLGPK
jgi:dienelactone hydrolase